MTLVRLSAAIAGWALLAYIGFATLSPIEDRPHIGGAPFERAAAYGLLGFLLAIAYPRQAVRILAVVAGAAILLELGQLLVPGRHAHIPDTLEKIIGGALGVAASLLLARIVRAWRVPH